MLSDSLFIQQSLINNVFYLRTIREFCLNIQLSFYQNNQTYIEIAEGFGKRYNELRKKVIKLANNKLPEAIIESESFVTKYTLDAEKLTEKLFEVNLDTDLTEQEKMIIPASEEEITPTKEELDMVSALNKDAIELTKNFIEFCIDLVKDMKNNTIFSSSYPLIYSYMIEEASLYANDLTRIQERTNADPTFVVNYEYWFSNSMKDASEFIMGLSDPEQTSIIINANNYRKIFTEQMKHYQEASISPETQKLLNEESIESVQNFISFLSKIIDGILKNELYFIVEPIFFDNLLTEAYYFLYLLKGTQYAVQ